MGDIILKPRFDEVCVKSRFSIPLFRPKGQDAVVEVSVHHGSRRSQDDVYIAPTPPEKLAAAALPEVGILKTSNQGRGGGGGKSALILV